MTKRVLFLTGTRADFGKLKPLISALRGDARYETFILATGMHMLRRYGSTWREVKKADLGELYTFVNQNSGDSMDSVLAKSVVGLSDVAKEIEPDLIVVHGDRVEALAGAIVGSFNRCRVAHIEGGEVSGTVDEAVRHAVTKLAHLHFVANDDAASRLRQLGERAESIFMIGSPEADVMSSQSLPSLAEVKGYYGFDFDNYAILIFHPVTTEFDFVAHQARTVVDFVLSSGRNFLVIYPNNDDGTDYIQMEYRRLEGVPAVRLVPSMRFEYYLTALKNADFIIGNSSSGIREASFFAVPSINLGSRQANRSRSDMVIDSGIELTQIHEAVFRAARLARVPHFLYGDGRSAARFHAILGSDAFWSTPVQKSFVDLPTDADHA